MPKVVDPDARRRVVVEALFRVVIRDGLQHASLRNVADEAGLNIGSLRHYFASHHELMLFAMRSMLERVTARMEHRMEVAPAVAELTRTQRRTLASDLLEEMLPLDDTRRAEVTVWIEFTLAARTDLSLAALASESAASTRALIGRMIGRMAGADDLEPILDVDTEVERLSSLIDGLSLNAVLHPDLVTSSECTRALDAHLDQLQRAVGQHTATEQAPESR